MIARWVKEYNRCVRAADKIVRKLREADRMLAEGTQVPEVCKALEISEWLA
jgi:hypothetical protein